MVCDNSLPVSYGFGRNHFLVSICGTNQQPQHFYDIDVNLYFKSVHFQVNEILICFQNGVEEVYLFDPQLLEELEFDDQKCAAYKPDISPTHPGEGLTLRPLCISDFDKGNAQGLPSSFL